MLNLLNAFSRAAVTIESDIVSLVEKVVSQAEEVSIGLKVTVKVEEQLREVRIIESKLLPLVFDNLLRNVVTHAGSSPKVQIDITCEDHFIKIILVDDGPGVAEEVRDRLFQKGVSTQGGGLGLYLSKHVVETIGGSIRLVDSEPGMGAKFEIRLPIIY